MADDRTLRREGDGPDDRRPRSSDAEVARYRGERTRTTADGRSPADRMARPGKVRGYETK